MKFHIKILKEAGYEEALFGISLNKNAPVAKMPTVAKKLAPLDGGHNKFLEQIQVWLEITAPRFWWQEFDTYRVGVSKSSQSTMHTVLKSNLNQSNFDTHIPDDYLQHLNNVVNSKDLILLKSLLPEGFLQTRMVNVNYKALKNIMSQRKHHKLPHWQEFYNYLKNNLKYAELLDKI